MSLIIVIISWFSVNPSFLLSSTRRPTVKYLSNKFRQNSDSKLWTWSCENAGRTSPSRWKMIYFLKTKKIKWGRAPSESTLPYQNSFVKMTSLFPTLDLFFHLHLKEEALISISSRSDRRWRDFVLKKKLKWHYPFVQRCLLAFKN